MKILIQFLKASLWGATLLALTLLLAVEGFAIYWKASLLKPESVVEQAQSTFSEVENLLELYDKARSGSVWENKEDAEKSDSIMREIQSRVNRILKEKCGDCGIYFSARDWKSDTGFVRNELTSLSDPKSVKAYNSVVWVLLVFASIAAALIIYLAVALFKYAKLGFGGIAVVLFLALPWLVVLSFLPLAAQPDYDWTRSFDEEVESVLFVILFFVVYLFVIYPPIIVLAKKNGVRIKSALLLRSCHD